MSESIEFTNSLLDLVIVGAGPVGLMCAYLAQLSGLSATVVDRSDGPLQVGRADALNARTLQLLEIVDLFEDLYAKGKTCNTSSIWANGGFVSRQSKWWDNLEGCFHKHFLMIGQSHLEELLDRKLLESGHAVRRSAPVLDIQLNPEECVTTLGSGEQLRSRFVIGADGARSFVREHFRIPFEITRPQLIWAVLDAVIETDFPKVPEIIVFQAQTSDVAWIPREGDLDRFYVRMDTHEFTQAEVLEKIRFAMRPHSLYLREVVWFSQFSVKESVAEVFDVEGRVFLAGDACHIHSVNGGQGLNTGIADAFNLIWKIAHVLHGSAKDEPSIAPPTWLTSYERERKPIALSVIETSAELVRATKFSSGGSHAEDYLKIVERRSGHITGMGIRYGQNGIVGERLHDLEVIRREPSSRQATHNTIRQATRLYSLLDYSRFTVFIFSDQEIAFTAPLNSQVIRIGGDRNEVFSSEDRRYWNQVIVVRPDGYIHSVFEVK